MAAWEQWESWRRLIYVSHDAISSATVLGEQGIAAITLLLEYSRNYAPEAFPDAVLAGVDLLSAAHPTAAPLANLQNCVHLGSNSSPDALLSDLAGLTISGQRKSLGAAASLISEGSTVMVHSASSSVMSVLTSVPHPFRVVCTEALPGGEGREMAHELVERGFQVELLADPEALSVVAGMDLILVGADAIGPGRSINKVGTCDLAEEASAYEVPMYTAASISKVLPEELFERAIRRVPAGDVTVGVGGLAEVVPLSWFAGVITELGILSPGELSKRATEQIVAKSLR